MKNNFIKTACIFLSLVGASLVSCGQQPQTTPYRTEIKSSFFNQMLELTNNKQIKNRALWERFVDVYRNHEDTAGDRKGYSTWRCEFWGKMMRGATLCYRYSQDEELYEILTETVEDLLTTQDSDGRFSSYDSGAEFTNWDMWGRKYIMTSLLHYYEICKDETLKNRIITALKKHADYIVSNVGESPKKSILDCGSDAPNVKGLNASTILEPFVNLYEITKQKSYLDFAEYIIEAGGTREGNMIDCLKEGTKLPHEYPIHKAYETLSFFEGVYRYARVVNNQTLANQTINFFEKVYESEVTIIGGAGNREEDFDNAVETQTQPHDPSSGSGNQYGIETCVTVTWMRVLNVLYENTHDIKYYNRFAQTAMNAFLGAVNLYNQKNYKDFGKDDTIVDGLPFDSYSPIINDSRGACIGGLSLFTPDTPIELYGCCVCIAPAAVGLMGINYFRQFDNKLYLNDYYSSSINSGNTHIEVTGNYLSYGSARLIVVSSSSDELMLRIPEWANEPAVTINGIKKDVVPNSYYSVGELKNIKNLTVEFNPRIAKKIKNQLAYFTYGPYTLAVDEFNNPTVDLNDLSIKDIALTDLKQVDCTGDEFVRFKASYNKEELIFTNYSSAGRKSYKASKSKCLLTTFFKNE